MQRTLSARDYYYPPLSGDQWEKTPPASLGWDTSRLQKAIDCARDHNSTAFLILHKGRIVVEEYWQGWNADTAMLIFSSAKSVTSLLIGMAQEQGRLSIDDTMAKHLGKGWTKAPPEKEAAIAIRHVLTMTSGLTDDLEYSVDAGTTWYYNTPAYWKLFQVIKVATGKDENDFSRDVLWSRTGMKSCAWNGRTMAASARDMARFGLMALSNGAWTGKDIIRDKAYLHDAIHRSQELNQSYGYLWWLNGEDSFRLPGPTPERNAGPMTPSAPPDMFAALGAGDKKIYIVPSLDLVVARHGGPTGEIRSASSSFDRQLWDALAPAVSPR